MGGIFDLSIHNVAHRFMQRIAEKVFYKLKPVSNMVLATLNPLPS